MDLEARVLELLKSIGIKAGQAVLDFGCGCGTYTIPAAKLVGEKGIVYALDKDGKVLNELMEKAESAGLNNIKRMDTCGGLRIDLADNSVDAVLLFDVLHSYYFPRANDRRMLLDEVHRVSKEGVLILVYPKHMESMAKHEIEKANFRLKTEYRAALVHDNRDLEQGQVLIFVKEHAPLGGSITTSQGI